MKYIRLVVVCLIALVSVTVSFGAGALFLDHFDRSIRKYYQDARNRASYRTRAITTLEELTKKYGDIPVEKWSKIDQARYYSAKVTLENLDEASFMEKLL